jgi:hypothetical protein
MSPTFDNLSPTLRKLALVGAQRDLTQDESLLLEAALVALLEQPSDIEEAIVSELLDELYELPEAVEFLLHELEIASTLVHLGAKEDQAVLLIALPVAFISGSKPRMLALSTDAMLEATSVLSDSNVVSEHARVALLPRLFRPEDLAAQSYGTFRNMTRLLGRQLLDGEPVRLDTGVFKEGPHTLDPSMAWGDNPYVELFYVVGVVSSHVSELDEIFPPVDDDEDDEHDESQNTSTGEPWEDAFLASLDDAFFPMFGAQATCLPTDFHDAIRQGLELWRESGLQQQLRVNFARKDIVTVVSTPFIDEQTGRFGWDLQLKDSEGVVRDQCPWEVLHHESEEVALEELEGVAGRERLVMNKPDRVYPDQ